MFNRNIYLIAVVLTFVACGTTKTAKLSSDNPADGIAEVLSFKEDAIRNQYDLLAFNNFKNGEASLNNAIFKQNNNDDRNDVLVKLSEAKAYFLDAAVVARSRTAVPERIMAARKATIDNGIREDGDLNEKLNDTDRSLRYKSESFSEVLQVETVSNFEKDYLRLEVNAVQYSNLSGFRSIVASAKSRNAEKIAPKTFRAASNDLQAAENMIQQSPRNAGIYNQSLINARVSTKLLKDVMDKLSGLAVGASEDAALKIVFQERKLAALSDKTKTLQSSLVRSNMDLDQANDNLEAKTAEAQTSQTKVRLQDAINQIRNNFSNKEAEVYQQGNDLIIRLKTIDFKSGSAMVPSESMDLLAKVNRIIEQLVSSKVLIEGHTDSTGRSGNNQTLSLKRSEAVAKYLGSLDSGYQISSKGFGESKPIANNETKEGRATNRRVDIVVSTVNQL